MRERERPKGGPAPLDLAASYRYCHRLTRSRARNFYYSFLPLPRAKRDALCAIYAFMRYCDDLADGEGTEVAKRGLLEQWREALDRSLAGDVSGSPVLPAFADTVQAYGIPPRYFHELLDGAEMDLEDREYRTFDDLYRYCYHVASVVGLVCIHVFGFGDPAAKQYAEWQGIAFQLTNILRDLAEDASLGRIYLPTEDLERFHYSPEDLRSGRRSRQFLELMRFEVERAEGFYRKSAPLLDLIDADSRPALKAMTAIYHGLLERIRLADYDVFTARVRLSSARKLALVARAMVGR